MRWDGEVCIVSGSYQAVASTPPRTVVELWCRAREGHSVVLLVDGLSPFLEIAPSGKAGRDRDLKDPLEIVQEMHEAIDTTSCICLLYTSPSPRDKRQSRMPSSA